jgi:hypothetical protein
MATSGQEINAETARWLADTVRSVLRDQLDEAARLDSKARELIGFSGLVLALLAAAIVRAGVLAGLEAILFGAGASLAVLLLGLAAGFAIFAVAAPGDGDDYYLKLDAGSARQLIDDPETLASEPWVSQVREAVPLVDALEHNAKVLEREQLRVSQAYVLFASGLGAAIIAILALVPAAL